VSLNIKNEGVHALVRELAERTGVSQTSAVEDAVRRRLDELNRPDEAARARRDVERVMQLVREFNEGLSDEDREHMRNADDWLYDEFGLPK
jgi:antitoxin VapB